MCYMDVKEIKDSLDILMQGGNYKNQNIDKLKVDNFLMKKSQLYGMIRIWFEGYTKEYFEKILKATDVVDEYVRVWITYKRNSKEIDSYFHYCFAEFFIDRWYTGTVHQLALSSWKKQLEVSKNELEREILKILGRERMGENVKQEDAVRFAIGSFIEVETDVYVHKPITFKTVLDQLIEQIGTCHKNTFKQYFNEEAIDEILKKFDIVLKMEEDIAQRYFPDEKDLIIEAVWKAVIFENIEEIKQHAIRNLKGQESENLTKTYKLLKRSSDAMKEFIEEFQSYEEEIFSEILQARDETEFYDKFVLRLNAVKELIKMVFKDNPDFLAALDRVLKNFVFKQLTQIKQHSIKNLKCQKFENLTITYQLLKRSSNTMEYMQEEFQFYEEMIFSEILQTSDETEFCDQFLDRLKAEKELVKTVFEDNPGFITSLDKALENVVLKHHKKIKQYAKRNLIRQEIENLTKTCQLFKHSSDAMKEFNEEFQSYEEKIFSKILHTSDETEFCDKFADRLKAEKEFVKMVFEDNQCSLASLDKALKNVVLKYHKKIIQHAIRNLKCHKIESVTKTCQLLTLSSDALNKFNEEFQFYEEKIFSKICQTCDFVENFVDRLETEHKLVNTVLGNSPGSHASVDKAFKNVAVKYYTKIKNHAIRKLKCQEFENVTKAFQLLTHSSDAMKEFNEVFQFYEEKIFLEICQRSDESDFVENVLDRLEIEKNLVNTVFEDNPRSLVSLDKAWQNVACKYLKNIKQHAIENLKCHKLENVTKIWQLLKHSSDAIKEFNVEFQFYEEKLFSEICQTNNESDFVDKFLDRLKIDKEFIKMSFDDNPGYIAELDKTIFKVINMLLKKDLNDTYSKPDVKISQVPNMLIKYCDEFLKKGTKGMAENDLETKLEGIITIFKYIDDKDLFNKLYSESLAKRLINSTSQSMNAEELMINKLRSKCGNEYVRRLEKMITDKTVSEELTREFTDSRGEVLPYSFSILVMQRGSWPIKASNSTLLVPQELENGLQIFNDDYSLKYKNRRLYWHHGYSTCDIKLNYLSKKYTMQTSVNLLSILVIFNNTESTTFSDIKTITGLVREDLIKYMKCLVAQNLLECPDTTTMSDDSKFNLNLKYENKRSKFKLVPIMKDVVKETEETERTLNEERKMFLQALIVRNMKTKKTMTHKELVNEVIQESISNFVPSQVFIKSVIEYLIQKEYMERAQDNMDQYNYLA